MRFCIIRQYCLSLCFLEDFGDKPAGELPIGSKKRLEIARALATEPSLLLLDESISGLTSTEIHEMLEMIRRLRDKGITILMVEHIMEAIMPLANTIVVLSHGEKIAEGQPQSIVHNQEPWRKNSGRATSIDSAQSRSDHRLLGRKIRQENEYAKSNHAHRRRG